MRCVVSFFDELTLAAEFRFEIIEFLLAGMPTPSRIVYTGSIKPKRRQRISRRWMILIVVIFVLAVLAWMPWYVLNRPYFSVKKIGVNGAVLISPSAVEGVARHDLAGNIWHIIPRANFLAVSTKRIGDDIRRAIPQIADISVEKTFPDSLAITIHERVLWGVYCSKRESVNDGAGSCFYLDDQGTAFQEFSSIEGSLLPIVYGEIPAGDGEEVLARNAIQFFNDAKSSLASVAAFPISMHVSTTTPTDVTLTTSEGWDLRLTMASPVDAWFAILKTLLDKEIGAKRSQLQYVDLRFGQKVFYKLK